jgi:hypothetical protein
MTDMKPCVPFLLVKITNSRTDHTCIMSTHMIWTSSSGPSKSPLPTRSSRTYQKTCDSIMSGGSWLEWSRAIGRVKQSRYCKGVYQVEKGTYLYCSSLCHSVSRSNEDAIQPCDMLGHSGFCVRHSGTMPRFMAVNRNNAISASSVGITSLSLHLYT